MSKEDYLDGFKDGYKEGFVDGQNTQKAIEYKKQLKESETEDVSNYIN